ncbi:helix-turn-helix domain-containing protein [Actinomadura opuntiae]|uniref:helix-turn-helix domain-containing protein n=1 Tax=Actinomadura sp. OS1-43 TaxID=604315 RepID=UPI00255A87F5|nr:helix-turn-helix domain-containing protein [Actinomadura sp. OS1-43]MDL4812804.1 helix-turn-helix domain-containing protein [Actinomadura sp. OS1-43]
MGALLLDRDDEFSRVLTITEAAAEVGRPPATVRDWIRKKYLVPLRVPGSRRVYTTAGAVRNAERRAYLNTPRPSQTA